MPTPVLNKRHGAQRRSRAATAGYLTLSDGRAVNEGRDLREMVGATGPEPTPPFPVTPPADPGRVPIERPVCRIEVKHGQ
jgi:hypothetical protein